MAEFFLWCFAIAIVALMLKIVHDKNKTYWIMKLKPDDKISVTIYSQYCECERDAKFTKISDDGICIEATIMEDCKSCSEARSKDKDGKETCWYKISSFKKNDIHKVK